MVEAPEPPHHHHHATGIPWFDFIIPIAVLCISIASLLTSLQSEKSMHALVEQNTRLVDAQSTPILMLDSANQSDDGKSVISMTLSNVGTGPAQIAWFHLTDKAGASYTGESLYTRVATLDPTASFTSEQISSSFLRSGDKRSVFAWPRPASTSAAFPAWHELNDTRFHLNASACYCSLFDECRITHFGDDRPKPVPNCQNPEPK